MRRLIPFLTIFVLACQALTPLSDAAIRSRPLPTERAISHSESPAAAEVTPYPPPLRSPQTRRERPAALRQTEMQTFSVRYHPDGPLYVGDLVSIEVIAPEGLDLEHSEVHISVEQASIGELGSAKFSAFGIGGRYQATLSWVWDTQGLDPGQYTLNLDIRPDVASWTEEVVLLPESGQPAPEPEADWESIRIDCCVLHYISGTPAERDISELMEVAELQSLSASQGLGREFEEPIQITILPRVLGHGGFASDEIHVSYLDRNYVNSNFAQVLQHEMVHILDGRLGGELRPSIFVEGLAVYLSGGHYKQEPLLSRAAVLQELGWYIPLESLADDFYHSQHEVGYLQASALIQYMVRAWGWEAFSGFYRDIHPHESEQASKAIDKALQSHFGLSFEQLEQRFMNELRSQHINPDLYEDVRLVVSFYETVRRYQQVLDPSAYFLTAWLPEGREMRERDLVADYLRRPSSNENIVLESLIMQAGEQLHKGDFGQAQRLLAIINQALEKYEQVEQSQTLPQGS